MKIRRTPAATKIDAAIVSRMFFGKLMLAIRRTQVVMRAIEKPRTPDQLVLRRQMFACNKEWPQKNRSTISEHIHRGHPRRLDPQDYHTQIGCAYIPKRSALNMNLCPRRLFNWKMVICHIALPMYMTSNTAVMGMSTPFVGMPPSAHVVGK